MAIVKKKAPYIVIKKYYEDMVYTHSAKAHNSDWKLL
jgi:hypothetical protein